MKNNCKPLSDFEASSVILFAALVAGDFSSVQFGPGAARAASRPAIRTSAPCGNGQSDASERRSGVPEHSSSQALDTGSQRDLVSAAARAAIARLDAGCTAGFVPLDGPIWPVGHPKAD